VNCAATLKCGPSSRANSTERGQDPTPSSGKDPVRHAEHAGAIRPAKWSAGICAGPHIIFVAVVGRIRQGPLLHIGARRWHFLPLKTLAWYDLIPHRRPARRFLSGDGPSARCVYSRQVQPNSNSCKSRHVGPHANSRNARTTTISTADTNRKEACILSTDAHRQRTRRQSDTGFGGRFAGNSARRVSNKWRTLRRKPQRVSV